MLVELSWVDDWLIDWAVYNVTLRYVEYLVLFTFGVFTAANLQSYKLVI